MCGLFGWHDSDGVVGSDFVPLDLHGILVLQLSIGGPSESENH